MFEKFPIDSSPTDDREKTEVQPSNKRDSLTTTGRDTGQLSFND